MPFGSAPSSRAVDRAKYDRLATIGNLMSQTPSLASVTFLYYLQAISGPIHELSLRLINAIKAAKWASYIGI